MNIAIVLDLYSDNGNGTSKSARVFVNELRKRGHNITILCQGDVNQIEDKDMVIFPKLTIPFFQKICEEQHAILAKPVDEKIRKAFDGIDIVHIYLPFFLGTHCAKIAEEMKIPVLGCYHMAAENISYNIGLDKSAVVSNIIYTALKQLHYKSKWIRDIHCPSKMIAEKISQYHYDQNLHIISNGYNKEFKVLDIEKPEKYKEKFVIISVGRLTKEKRQDLIIKAIGHSKYKDNIVLILAGKGPKENEYRKLVKEYNIDCDFVFLSQEELINLLNCGDLYIQASSIETESIACLEAIACGLVPVISDGELCATKQFSLVEKSLFIDKNYQSLKEQIEYWYENENERKKMSKKYANFAKKFRLDKSIDAIIYVYKKIIKNNKKRITDYNEIENISEME